MAGLGTGTSGLWGGYRGLLGGTALSTPPGLLADALYGGGTPAGNVLGPETSGMAVDFTSSPPNMLIRSQSSYYGSYYSGVPFGGLYQTTGPITFSRASLGTVVDSDGKVKWAPHNLFLASEQFDASSWIKTDITVTANAISAPNGTTTADLLTAGSAGTDSCSVNVSSTANISHTIGMFVKRGNTNWLFMRFGDSTNQIQGWWNVNTGQAGSTNNLGAAAGATATIRDAGGGWYECILSGAANGNVTSYTFNGFMVTADVSTTRVSNSTRYQWGAYCYRSDLGGMQANMSAYPMYNPTTPKNLLGYTEAFDNAAWTKTDTTITADATTAPNGLTTADLATEGSAGTAQIGGSATVTSGALVAISYHLKRGNTDWVRITVINSTNFFRAWINLATGAIGTTGASGTGSLTSSSITNVGNGWYRVGLIGSISGATSYSIFTCTVTADNSATRVSGGTYYLWGAQLSDSASLDPYVPNHFAAPSAAAYHGPRLDYDPATLAAKGLLVEQQSSNLCLRSEEFDNASWTKSNLTVAANSVVAPSGATTANTLTATAGNATITQGVTTTAVAFTFSIYLKRKTGTGNIDITMDGTTWVTQTINSSTWTRCIVTQTGVAGTSNPGVRIVTNGDEVYAWGAQAE